MSLMKIISEGIEFFNCRCPFCPGDGAPLKVSKDRYACSSCNAMGDLIAFLITHKFFSYQEAEFFTIVDMHRDNQRQQQIEKEEQRFRERRDELTGRIESAPKMIQEEKKKYLDLLQNELEDYLKGNPL